MNYLILIGIGYLFLKFKDITKDLSDLNNRLDNLDNTIDRMEYSNEENKEC